MQNHPRIYEDTLYKANIKREFHLHGLEIAIKVCYDISEEYQRAFWTKVCTLCSRIPKFTHSVFLISEYDLKLLTKRDSVLQVCNVFWAHLNQCFILENEDDISANDFCSDLGMEDTPTLGLHRLYVTLLRKTPCLEY